jgi:hypothetical protein
MISHVDISSPVCVTPSVCSLIRYSFRTKAGRNPEKKKKRNGLDVGGVERGRERE